MIVSIDSEAGGIEEFVVMDRISERDNRFVLVVGAGGGGEAMKQCLKDGIFQMSEKMEILFNTMGNDKER